MNTDKRLKDLESEVRRLKNFRYPVNNRLEGLENDVKRLKVQNMSMILTRRMRITSGGSKLKIKHM